eukprot:TRINITY_DN36173_c0_g1_i1.p1 TRINITY_DN36173_c0_g1~~TRINITY_DN36173_c0_g1_i1.p1  ORF type:complete len:314 (+),score=83.29 TRINITY_DN36173_c0_g1_i1:49-942(+)
MNPLQALQRSARAPLCDARLASRGAAARQVRRIANPYMPAHQEGEMAFFPSLPQPKVLYTGDKKFDVAYILQREPVVTPEVHPMVRDFEKRIKEEHRRYPRTTEGSNLSQAVKKSMPDVYKTLSGQGASVYWREPKFVQQELTLLRSHKIGERTTALDVDDTSERKSLNRRFMERLFLIIQKDNVWQFPTARRKQGETLRSTVDRALLQDHRARIETHSLSNAPTGHHTDGDVVTCFFPVYYLTGLPQFPLQGSTQHAWVTRNELREYSFPTLEYKRAAYEACYDDWMPHNVPIFDN